ncbi:unnamed protein product [Allacma fusca]|uniref:4-hydroxybenzoate polyprenyltransferase, mitochondrial n=1 Tax=Allacma fusca TaxID=39272 RepID=A0A8J2JV63_9HEXA|nr:unnamed protein product [Allacma fusca]
MTVKNSTTGLEVEFIFENTTITGISRGNYGFVKELETHFCIVMSSLLNSRMFLNSSQLRRSVVKFYIYDVTISNSFTVLVPPRNVFWVRSHLKKLSSSTHLSQISSLNGNHRLNSSHHDSIKQPKALPEILVDAAPLSWQNYLKISRMNRPIGTWLLFWPCTWGLTLGTGGTPALTTLGLFGLGAFIMRGAGCTINDMWDHRIDAKVKRTRTRPLACGHMRMRHATAWLGVQLSVALTILCQLNAPCFILGVGSLGLVVLYPLAKRVTNWPQAILGLTFNTGILVGYTATQSSQLGYLAMPWTDPACLAFYLSGLSWTLIYDTIYAHQDVEDDALLGLGSTARKFGDKTKYWLTGFSTSMVGSLTAAGIFADASWPFYAGVAATATHLAWQLRTLDINNPENCADRFTSNRHIGWRAVSSVNLRDYRL